MMKRMLAILLALALLLSVSAVFAEDAAATAETTETTETTEAAEPATPVLLVTAFGEEITDQTQDLLNTIENYNNFIAQYGMDPYEESMQTQIRSYSLSNLIESKTVLNKAKELGLDVYTDEEKAQVEKEAMDYWDEAIQYYMENYFGISDESSEEEVNEARTAILSAFDQSGLSLDTLTLEFMQEDIVARVESFVTESVEATDEAILEHFNATVDADKSSAEEDLKSYVSNFDYAMLYPDYYDTPYFIPEGYRTVIHILLIPDQELLDNWKGLAARLEESKEASDTAETTETTETTDTAETTETTETTDAAETTAEPEEPVTEEMVEAARQAIMDSLKDKIDEIKKRLDEGESFETLIAEFGGDPGMQDPQLLKTGYAVHPLSSYDAAFLEASLKLEKVGDTSEPVLGQYGVHIIRYLKELQPGAIELTDELKSKIKDTLDEDLKQMALTETIDKWIAEAEAAGQIVWTETGAAWRNPPQAEEPAEDGAADTAEAAGTADTAETAGTAETAETAETEAAPAE